MAKHVLIINAVAYAFCFVVEGAMRWTHGIGSVTRIEQTIAGRGAQAKALVARERQLSEMYSHPAYFAYICIIFFGTPLVIVVMMVKDYRFAKRISADLWMPVRYWIVAMAIFWSLSSLMLLIGPYLAAERFYDRKSPAELLGR